MTIKCPWCGEENFNVKGNAFLNADVYANVNLVVTVCCGNPVTITPRRSYAVTQYKGDRTEDDWGNNIKQPKNNAKEYRAMRRLKRGDTWRGLLVYDVNKVDAGGEGLAAWPDSVTVVLVDGSIWEGTDPTVLAPQSENPCMRQGPLK